MGGTKGIIEDLAGRLRVRGVSANAVYLRSLDEHVRARSHPALRVMATARDFLRLTKRFLRERPRQIVTFTPLLGALVALGSLPFSGTRVVATHHSLASRIGRTGRWLDRLCARLGAYDAIVACAPVVAASYSSNGAHYLELMTVIPNGVESSNAPRSTNPAGALRQSVGLPAGASLAFAAGRLAKEKNYSLLLRAIALAPDWYLVFAGDGSARQALEVEARELGVVNRVRFLGVVPREQVADWLSACDVFVQPSIYEGLSLSLLEAMARGAPVLTSDVPENRDPLMSPAGTLGWLLPGDKPEEWADVLALVRENPAVAEVVGARARKHQREEFDQELMYSRYLQLICGEPNR